MNDVHQGSRASGNGPGTKGKLCNNKMEREQDIMKYELPSQPTYHGLFPKEMKKTITVLCFKSKYFIGMPPSTNIVSV